MTINKFRGFLYALAKILGDVQSVGKAGRKRSAKPVGKRIMRRAAGRATGKMLGALFR